METSSPFWRDEKSRSEYCPSTTTPSTKASAVPAPLATASTTESTTVATTKTRLPSTTPPLVTTHSVNTHSVNTTKNNVLEYERELLEKITNSSNNQNECKPKWDMDDVGSGKSINKENVCEYIKCLGWDKTSDPHANYFLNQCNNNLETTGVPGALYGTTGSTPSASILGDLPTQEYQNQSDRPQVINVKINGIQSILEQLIKTQQGLQPSSCDAGSIIPSTTSK